MSAYYYWIRSRLLRNNYTFLVLTLLLDFSEYSLKFMLRKCSSFLYPSHIISGSCESYNHANLLLRFLLFAYAGKKRPRFICKIIGDIPTLLRMSQSFESSFSHNNACKRFLENKFWLAILLKKLTRCNHDNNNNI